MDARPPLDAWPTLAPLDARPLSGGLINATFAVGEPPVAAVQRLNPIFAPEVHLDIEAITAHLERAGLPTPRLIRTGRGDLWHVDEAGGCWRALTWMPGHTHHRLRDARLVRSAGAFVGRWHRAVADLDHTFHFTRPGAHDTLAHMATLEAALDAHPAHRLRDAVGPVADAILDGWRAWDGDLGLDPWLAHGDLKVSNLRFDAAGEATCLVDLDTMAWLPPDVELGDAWRSWCNPCSEDATETRFDLDLLAPAATGYLSTNPLPAALRRALGPGVERICLELAARFAADALNESYFGWSPAIAPTRGDHNLLRARGQLSLARSVRAQAAEIEALLLAG